MRSINLLSLAQAYSSLEKHEYLYFVEYFGIEVKDEEVEDLTKLVEELYGEEGDINVLNQFYVGYEIPQIGKEFDLLRFGSNFVINVELKKTSTE